MSKLNNEASFLDSVTSTYVTSESAQERLIKNMSFRVFEPYITNECGSALELGCSDGFMTSLISDKISSLTVVDGSATFLNTAKEKTKNKNIKFIHSLFEDFEPRCSYDYIFATYVLEHVIDPVFFLKKIKHFLGKNGLAFIVVPNARSLSRQLARHMGLIENIFSLTENDVNHGHRRVYDRALLNRDIDESGLFQISQGGILLKPFADFQMDNLLNMNILGEQQINGLYKMGLEYPDFAGSIFSICTSPS